MGYGGHVPVVPLAAGHGDILVGAGLQAARFIPGGGQHTEQGSRRTGGEVLARVAHGLYAALVQGGQGHLVAPGGEVPQHAVLAGKLHGRIVHGAYHVARQGQCDVVRGGGGQVVEVVLLAPVHGLAGDEVGPGAAQARRACAAVEVHHELLFGGHLQQLLIFLHHGLAVILEEVYLHAGKAQAFPLGQDGAYLLLVVAEAVLVTPDEHFHALRGGIGRDIGQGIGSAVPPGVEGVVGPVHVVRHVDIVFHDVQVVAFLSVLAAPVPR